MHTELIYDIQLTDIGVYLHLVNKPDLDPEILDSIESFGVSFEDSCRVLEDQASNTRRLILDAFKKEFTQVWDFAYGIPYFRFVGDLTAADIEEDRAYLFYFQAIGIEPDAEFFKVWKSVISVLSKIEFRNSDQVLFITRDHQVALKWLKKQSYSWKVYRMQEATSECEKRHINWYPDPVMREELLAKARGILSEFVMAKQVNIPIKGFLVVPIFHARRYQKAYNALMKLYQPLFIMTLPVTYKEKYYYTVLFPITKPLNQRNYALPKRRSL